MLTGRSPVVICIEVNCLNSLIIVHIKINWKKKNKDSKNTDEQNAYLHWLDLRGIIKAWTLCSTKQNFPDHSKSLSLLQKLRLPTKDQTSSWFSCSASRSWPPGCPHSPSALRPFLLAGLGFHFVGHSLFTSQDFSRVALPQIILKKSKSGTVNRRFFLLNRWEK